MLNCPRTRSALTSLRPRSRRAEYTIWYSCATLIFIGSTLRSPAPSRTRRARRTTRARSCSRTDCCSGGFPPSPSLIPTSSVAAFRDGSPRRLRSAQPFSPRAGAYAAGHRIAVRTTMTFRGGAPLDPSQVEDQRGRGGSGGGVGGPVIVGGGGIGLVILIV